MTAHEQVLMGLPTLAEIEQRLGEWVVTVSGNRKALLDIPLQYTDKTTISRRFVSEVTGLPEETLRIALRDHRHLLADLEQEMHREGIIVQGYNILDSEQSRLVLRWYEHLTDEEKLQVELRGDLVAHIGYLNQMEAFKKSPLRYPLYKIKRAEIAQDVMRRRELVDAIQQHEIAQRVEAWANKALASRQALLDVELGIKEPLAIAPSYLEKEFGAGVDRIQASEWLTRVIQGMQRENIILPGYSPLECEARRKILRWYENLSDEQKLGVEVFGGQVKMKGYLDQVPELVPGHKLLPLYNETREEIASDVIRRREDHQRMLDLIPQELDPVTESRLQQWSDKVIQSRTALLDVELGSGKDPNISTSYLSEQIGIQLDTGLEHPALQRVIDAMVLEKIVVQGYGSTECNLRRIALRWFERLDDREKARVRLINGQIAHVGTLDQIDGIELNHRHYALLGITRTELGQAVLTLQEQYPPEDTSFSHTVQNQLNHWVASVLGRREKLLEIELAQKGRLAVSATYVSNLTGLSKDTLYGQTEMPEVLQAMIAEGIIVEGYNVGDCDKRRRLLRWYEGLDDLQKLAVETHGDQVKPAYLETIREVAGIRPSPLYNLTRTEIGKDVLRRRAEVAAPPGRTGTHEVKRRVDEWLKDVLSSREKLLTVQLNASGPLAVSVPYLSEQLGISKSVLNKYNDMPEVIEAMKRERIILPGYMSSECDKRRKLLRWYEGLSEQEKFSIPLFGNKIKKKGYLDQIPGVRELLTSSMHKLINLTLDEISEDLVRLGVGNSDYKTVEERELEKAQKPKEETVGYKKHFFALRAVSVASVADLAQSADIPFTPVMHLFAAATMQSHSESGQSNYYDACKCFIQCLVDGGHNEGDSVLTMLGEHTLTRFRKYLQSLLQNAQISTAVANTHMSAARRMLERATEIDGLGLHSFYPAPGFDVARETDLYNPYSPGERSRISEAIQTAIAHTHALAQPYVCTGVGQDPYDEHGKVKVGIATLETARWIFENKLGCVPINFANLDVNDKYHKYFRNVLNASSLSIYEIYESWGVLYDRSSKVLAPYIARLAQVTGLNADSIATLQLDDFVPVHPLSQRPCLRYWKERSTGEKEYHLDIFKAEISWLTTSQAREIKKIFDDVILITSEFRGAADPAIKNDLFIYKAISTRTYGEIKSISGQGNILNIALKGFAEAKGLLTDGGERLSLSPSRFRPSFVSELVERGVSVREIQMMLGHESIETTLKYLERMDFNRVARDKLEIALREIHSETITDKPVTAAPDINSGNDDNIIFKTPLGGCKNIFNPPDFIKNLRNYVPGKPCALYNKCLACENNMITKSDLPALFAMRRDYLHILHTNRVADTPYGYVVLENLNLLENILDPELSDFSQEELEEAERLSEYVDTNIAIEGVGQ